MVGRPGINSWLDRNWFSVGFFPCAGITAGFGVFSKGAHRSQPSGVGVQCSVFCVQIRGEVNPHRRRAGQALALSQPPPSSDFGAAGWERGFFLWVRDPRAALLRRLPWAAMGIVKRANGFSSFFAFFFLLKDVFFFFWPRFLFVGQLWFLRCASLLSARDCSVPNDDSVSVKRNEVHPIYFRGSD